MPKSTSVSKSAEIRRVLGEIGWDSSPREVQTCLEAKGTTVTAQQVSNEKSRRVKRPLPLSDLPVSVLKKVKALVDEFGSSEVVRKALDELDELTIGHRRVADFKERKRV